MLRFAVVGIDHGHIFDHVNGLLAVGAEFAGYCEKTSVPELVDAFRRTYPDAPVVDRETIFGDDSIERENTGHDRDNHFISPRSQ